MSASPSRTRIFWQRLRMPAVLLLVVVLVVWWMRDPAPEVEVGLVDRGPVRVTVDEVGTTRIRHHAEVHATVMGRWVPGAFEVGDVLQAGAVLGTMYPAPLDGATRAQAEARAAAAAATMRAGKAELEQAGTIRADAVRTRRRMEQVGAVGGVSTEAVERAQDAAAAAGEAYEAAWARLDALQADWEAARAVLRIDRAGGIVVRAPSAGSLLQWNEPHERVLAAGAPLARIGDPGDIDVLVPLLTSDAAQVNIGASAIVRISASDANRADTDRGARADGIPGAVQRIEPTAFTKVSALGVEEQRVWVIVGIPHDSLRGASIGDQFRAEVSIVVAETSSALRVPVSALVHDGATWHVWAVTEGRATRHTVRLGLRNADHAAIHNGLEEGDMVIRYPGETVREGARIKNP